MPSMAGDDSLILLSISSPGAPKRVPDGATSGEIFVNELPRRSTLTGAADATAVSASTSTLQAAAPLAGKQAPGYYCYYPRQDRSRVSREVRSTRAPNDSYINVPSAMAT
jgi:hypothetical protein